ncbi:transposase [Flavobacterium kingsejongi]|uniref:transposase n=1 Tax=Flavobacterium kingsejongi TaxID=1678728 RepID=UPI001300B476
MEKGVILNTKNCLHKISTSLVEPVFAQLKHNNGFRRFSLKGLQKVELEFGLMALGHNLRKKIAA